LSLSDEGSAITQTGIDLSVGDASMYFQGSQTSSTPFPTSGGGGASAFHGTMSGDQFGTVIPCTDGVVNWAASYFDFTLYRSLGVLMNVNGNPLSETYLKSGSIHLVCGAKSYDFPLAGYVEPVTFGRWSLYLTIANNFAFTADSTVLPTTNVISLLGQVYTTKGLIFTQSTLGGYQLLVTLH
jgi:hypothetical protein